MQYGTFEAALFSHLRINVEWVVIAREPIDERGVRQRFDLTHRIGRPATEIRVSGVIYREGPPTPPSDQAHARALSTQID